MDTAEGQESRPHASDDACFIVKSFREDSRTQISADARHIAKCAREAAEGAAGRIVKHLWIIFVLLPVLAFVIYKIASA